MARGFRYGTGQPGDLLIGWNGGHTAVTLPDGTPVASGERGGVNIGGLGAYQKQFTHHMFLPMSAEMVEGAPDLPAPDLPAPDMQNPGLPAPDAIPAPEPIVVAVDAVNPDVGLEPLAPAPDSVV